MFFKTKRLYIRKLDFEDLDNFHEMQSNYNVMKYILGRAKSKEENINELKRIINNYKIKKTALVMAVSIKNDDHMSLIGTCAVIKKISGEFEVGYRVMEKHWGKGYGAEILDGLLNYCLNDLGLNPIVSIVDSENSHSVKILENSPMRFIREFSGSDQSKVKLYKIDKWPT